MNEEMTPAQAWWWDMSEAQKEFWYASRSKFEAERLDRRIRAGWWFLAIAGYLLMANWVWVVNETWGLWEAAGDGVHVVSWFLLVVLTMAFLRGLWLHLVTIEHTETTLERFDTRRRKRAVNQGVGDAWDDPAELDLSVKTEDHLNTFDEQHEFEEIASPNPRRRLNWRRNSRET